VQQHVMYDVVAVVQHMGSGHSSGHYTMYRKVQAASAAAHTALCNKHVSGDAATEAACQGVHGATAEQQGRQGSRLRCSSSSGWLRASDGSVTAVSEQDVLQCHATLLVYEKRQ
jgi:hypothetical protein